MSYQEAFEMLGLPTNTPDNYKNAETFARHFKRCSILEDSNVSYSANSQVRSGSNNCSEAKNFKVK